MTPAIAPARVRLALKIDIAFSRYRNMTRIASQRIYVLGNITTHIEIFIHRQNQIRFHNRSFHAGG